MARYGRGYGRSYSSGRGSSSRSYGRSSGRSGGGFRTRTSSSGYRQYNSGGGWKYTHRAVASKKVGGSIYKGNHVHHINGDKHDNRPSNLRVLSASDHAKVHKT